MIQPIPIGIYFYSMDIGGDLLSAVYNLLKTYTGYDDNHIRNADQVMPSAKQDQPYLVFKLMHYRDLQQPTDTAINFNDALYNQVRFSRLIREITVNVQYIFGDPFTKASDFDMWAKTTNGNRYINNLGLSYVQSKSIVNLTNITTNVRLPRVSVDLVFRVYWALNPYEIEAISGVIINEEYQK